MQIPPFPFYLKLRSGFILPCTALIRKVSEKKAACVLVVRIFLLWQVSAGGFCGRNQKNGMLICGSNFSLYFPGKDATILTGIYFQSVSRPAFKGAICSLPFLTSLQELCAESCVFQCYFNGTVN